MAIITLETLDKATEKKTRAYAKRITESYKQTMININQELKGIYDKYAKNGVLHLEDLKVMNVSDKIRVSRLNQVYKNIDDELKRLNGLEYNTIKPYLTEVFEINYNDVGRKITQATGNIAFELINERAVNKALGKPMRHIRKTLGIHNKTTFMALKRDIVNGITMGESIDEMSDRIQKTMTSSRNRAVRIARTETTGVMSDARLESFQKAQEMGIQLEKMWVATNDDRTRSSHAGLSGESIPLEEEFSNGLMYPGDQNGPASEVINCRCTMVANLLD